MERREKVAEAADVAKAKPPVGDESVNTRIRELRSRIREADDSINTLTQKARLRVRNADDSLNSSKQEAQSKVREAGALLKEAQRTEDSLQGRLSSLKIIEVAKTSVPDLGAMEAGANPLSQLEQEVNRSRRLWTQMENLTQEYNKELALLEDEKSVNMLAERIWLTIVRAQCLGGEEMNRVYQNLVDIQVNIPEDVSGRVHRLAKILIFMGDKGLLRSLGAASVAYADSARRARTWWLFLWKSRHAAECTRLHDYYESFRNLVAEVAGTYGALLNRWPFLGQSITPQEEQVVTRLSQAQPALLDWRQKGELPRSMMAARAAPSKNFCTKCGTKLPANVKFCTKCGRSVG